MKISFTSTIVLLTVFINSVSPSAIPKRALPDIIVEDLNKISTAITAVSSDLSRLPSGAPDVTTSFINHLQDLISTMATAAIDVEGQPTLTDDDVNDLNNHLNPDIVQLLDLLSTITERSDIIKNTPQLPTAVPEALGSLKSATAAYGNALISIDPNDAKPLGVESSLALLAQFDAVLAALDN